MARRNQRSGKASSGGRPVMRGSDIDWSRHHLGPGAVPLPVEPEAPVKPPAPSNTAPTPRALRKAGSFLVFDEFRIAGSLRPPHRFATAVQDELWTSIIEQPKKDAWLLRRAAGLGIVLCDQADVMAARDNSDKSLRRCTSSATLQAIGRAALPMIGTVQPTGVEFTALPPNPPEDPRHDLRVLYDPAAPGNERLAKAQDVIRRELAYSLAVDAENVQLTTPYVTVATVKSEALPVIADQFTDPLAEAFDSPNFVFGVPSPTNSATSKIGRPLRWDHYYRNRANTDSALPIDRMTQAAQSLGYTVTGIPPRVHIT